MQTKSLMLVLQTIEEARAEVEAMSPADRAHVSVDWLARLGALTSPDPWTLGFSLVHRDSETVVGSAGFKGPPTPDGVVEISYGVNPDHQGNGYATEAAQALTDQIIDFWLGRCMVHLFNLFIRLIVVGFRRLVAVFNHESPETERGSFCQCQQGILAFKNQ